MKNLFIFLIFCTSCFAKEFVISADQWCPYNCIPGTNAEGYIVELTKAILEPMGYDVVYREMPWARTLVKTRIGDIHGAIGAIKTDAPDFVYYNQSFGFSTSSIYQLKDSKWQYKDKTSYENIVIGVIRGYSYGDGIDQHIEKYMGSKNVVVVNNLNSLVGLLVNGVINIYPEDNTVMNYFFKKNDTYKDIIVTKYSAVKDEVYIALSPKWNYANEMGNILSDGITRLRENGKLELILQKYGLTDWMVS